MQSKTNCHGSACETGGRVNTSVQSCTTEKDLPRDPLAWSHAVRVYQVTQCSAKDFYITLWYALALSCLIHLGPGSQLGREEENKMCLSCPMEEVQRDELASQIPSLQHMVATFHSLRSMKCTGRWEGFSLLPERIRTELLYLTPSEMSRCIATLLWHRPHSVLMGRFYLQSNRASKNRGRHR